MAFDVKDGMDVDTSDGVLIEDHFLEMLTEKQLFEIYASSPDEDDEQNRPLKETLSDSELHEYFRDYCSFMYFRLAEPHANKPLKEVLALIRQYSFGCRNIFGFKATLLILIICQRKTRMAIP